MKFETAKNLVKGFLIAGIVCCVAAIFMNQTGSTMACYYLFMGAVGCIIVDLFLVITCLKCPWCGKRIVRKCLVLKACPYCRRNLTTGAKMKGKKAK